MDLTELLQRLTPRNGSPPSKMWKMLLPMSLRIYRAIRVV